VLGQFVYVVGGGCPLSWKGFSMEAFADFWEFIKLSSASGVMLWYFHLTATRNIFLLSFLFEPLTS